MIDNKNALKGFIKGGVCFSLILLFSGCELPWAAKKEQKKVALAAPKNKESKKEGEALFLIDGNVSITETEFKDYVDKIIVMNPQFKHIIETVPAVRYNIFTGMMNEKVLKSWVKKTDITQTSDYQKDYDLAVSILEHELARKYFQAEVASEVMITASEIKKFYDENKSKNQSFIAQEGDVHVAGAFFDTAKARDDFANVLKGNEKDIIKKAQEVKIAYKDLGRIAKDTKEIDASLKQVALSFGKDVNIAKAQDKDGKFWCLSLLDVKETEYYPLTKVQDGIEQMLKSEKVTAIYTKKLENLKVAYHAQEKKEYFDMPDQSALLEQKLAVANQNTEQKEKTVTKKISTQIV